VSLELPVLNHNQGTIAEARAKRDESAARFTALQAEIIGEIDTAMENYRRAIEQIPKLQATREVDSQREEALAAQVQAGAADPLDLTSLRLEQIAGMMLEEEAESRAELAFGRLENSLQQIIGNYSYLRAAGSSRPQSSRTKGQP
jgi:formiminotetrahydrofolate cyclodeaminase